LNLHYETTAPGTFLELGFLDVEVNVLCQAEQWGIAAEKQKKVVALSRTILGEHHRDTRDRVIGLGAVYLLSKNYTKAEKLMKVLLEELEHDANRSNSNLLDCLLHLKTLYREQKRYKEAIHFVTRELEIAEALPGKESMGLIAYMEDLAQLHTEAEDFESAVALRLKILEASNSGAGEVSGESLGAMHALADAYFDLENFGEAELQYRHALRICHMLHGEENDINLCLLGSLESTIAQDPERADGAEEIANEIRRLETSIEVKGVDR
jgi:tetratricopeptide (TPR) repeat protein